MARLQAGEGVAAHATERSQNAKIGPVSVTTTGIQSCGACPLKDRGCYAQQGPLGWMVARMDRHVVENGLDEIAIANAEASAIDGLSTRTALRLHQAGDCKTNEAARIVSEAADRHAAWTGFPSWSYTHQWRGVDRESWNGVSILASCDTLDQIPDAQARGYATAVVVESFPSQKAWKLDNGQTIVPCPEMTGRAMSCADCKLCWNDKRLLASRTTIAFEVHGSQSKKAALALKMVTQS